MSLLSGCYCQGLEFYDFVGISSVFDGIVCGFKILVAQALSVDLFLSPNEMLTHFGVLSDVCNGIDLASVVDFP